MLWILYNDQPPNQPVKDDNGHSKGVLLANDVEGFWLIHSVPNFPPKVFSKSVDKEFKINNSFSEKYGSGKYSYPSTGKEFGQSFMCISTKMLDVIGRQFQYNEIIVYEKNLPDKFKQIHKTLFDAANENYIERPPFNSMAKFQSEKGFYFISFAKSGKWHKG